MNTLSIAKWCTPWRLSWSWLRRMRVQLPPALRVSLGLSALMISCLLVLDIAFDLLPDQTALQQQLRLRVSENLAIQVAVLLEGGDSRALAKTLNASLAREPSMRSVGIRSADGALVLQVGEHTRHWVAPPAGESMVDYVRVPLLSGKGRWGDVEISYRPVNPGGLRGFFAQPAVLLPLLLGFGALLLFTLYLKRVFSYLDPSSVIPERVRQAFDAFAEGVMVLDAEGRIMLANAVLRAWIERAGAPLLGRAAHEVPALKAALPGNPKEYPWAVAIATRAPVKGGYIELAQESGSTITATVNCAPVFDATRKLRGCIVTLDDVTERENLNRQMVGLFAELNESKAQIERQNEELRRLATRDPLTGCLNRRAFSEKLDPLFAAAQGATTALTCIITDIDHFKSFNDRYGHAVGDQVLQVFARSLSSGLRECDLLCRYGGEEFLIVLPGLDAAQAAEVAERLRVEVGERAGKGVRSTPGLAITASFGVASLTADITDPAQIIERADQAMYVAKRSGRNRVTQWAEGMAQQA